MEGGDLMTMPNFLIIGAQKAGTTSLYYYLEQHPQVYMSPRKEPHFFEGTEMDFRGPGRKIRPVTDPGEYRALFDGASTEAAIGEASASYLYSRRSPALIRKSIPDVRLIVVLRNPADRAYSNFLHMVRVGREPVTDFSQALAEEEVRKGEGWGPLWHYGSKGYYHEQLERYFDTFGEERILAHLYEDLRSHPFEVLRRTFEFLGVDEGFVPDISRDHNPSGLPKNPALYKLIKRLASHTTMGSSLTRLLPDRARRRVERRILSKPPPMDPAVRRQLVGRYREDILRLEGLIGRDLGAWLRAESDPKQAA
jgi:hypothetical protein